MSDKPGCTTLAQLDAIRAAQEETGRIWSIDFSERFEVPAMTRAAELVAEGAIGRVVQTTGLGPHRLNAATRPDWFFDRARYGGILTDIGSHQIDQFLFLTGSTDATVLRAYVANYANPIHPGLQDFGEIVLQSGDAHGYIRVDRRPADLGRRAADDPRDRRIYRAAKIYRRRWHEGHRPPDPGEWRALRKGRRIRRGPAVFRATY